MDTLDNIIVVSVPDTMAISTTHKEVFFHSCPATRTQFDVALTHEITSSILWAVVIIGVIIVLCIAISAYSKYKEQKHRLIFEEQKRRENTSSQESKEKFESAWRFFNMCWRVEHPEILKDKEGRPIEYNTAQKLTTEDKEKYEEAWSVVNEYIRLKSIDKTEK